MLHDENNENITIYYVQTGSRCACVLRVYNVFTILYFLCMGVRLQDPS